MRPDKVHLVSGNANLPLAENVSRHLGMTLGNSLVSKFTDGEINVQIKDNIRGKDVYIIQPTCPPVNENLMELLLLISTARRGAAKRVTAVVPYYGYARKDRRGNSRIHVSAADIASLLETIGVDRVMTVDFHCAQIQGFFNPRIPADNISINSVLLKYVEENKEIFKDPNNIVIVAPEADSVARARKFQALLDSSGYKGVGLAMIIKQRRSSTQVERMDLVGNVTGKDCIIIDDALLP